MKIKTSVIFVVLMLFLGLIMSIYLSNRNLKNQSNLIELTFNDTFNINVEDAYNEHGIYILNSKYFIKSSSKVIGNDYSLAKDNALWRPNSESYNPTISDISAPFNISKTKNNDTIFLKKTGAIIKVELIKY